MNENATSTNSTAIRLTKLEHSGLVLEKNGQKLVFDPVEFTEKLPPLTGVVGVVITHQHNDHYQPDQISKIIVNNPDAMVFAASDVPAYNGDDFEIIPKQPSETAEVADFKLKFFGGNHAAIFPGQTPCRNLGVLVDDEIIVPGDSFDLPVELLNRPKILLAPIAAPWCKISEVADYIAHANPEIVVPVHDAVLSPLGQGFSNNILGAFCQGRGISYVPLAPGSSL